MSGKNRNLSLTAYDELFQTAEERQEGSQECIQTLPLELFHPFPEHPFQVRDDEKMEDTARSIAQFGVLVPILARPRLEGGYEIVSGHRRHHASELAGLKEIPAIIRDMDDDEATIVMVDSSLQREQILPSEKAFAYKMKLDAISHVKGRPKNVGQLVPQYFGMRTTEVIAEGTGESYKQIQSYIRLTHLVPPPSVIQALVGGLSHEVPDILCRVVTGKPLHNFPEYTLLRCGVGNIRFQTVQHVLKFPGDFGQADILHAVLFSEGVNGGA